MPFRPVLLYSARCASVTRSRIMAVCAFTGGSAGRPGFFGAVLATAHQINNRLAGVVVQFREVAFQVGVDLLPLVGVGQVRPNLACSSA